MISDHTLRLLILNDSEAEAERLISMLHNAGKNTRAQLVNAETIEALIQGQNWDLMIAQDSASDTDVCLQTIFRVNKDIPVILQSTDDDTQTVVEGMKRGAADVVVLDQDQHLLLVIDREINNRQQRQSRISADKKRREAEQRAHELLDSSRDGIAFIQDGLCLYVNASFAESFGYEDIEDVAYTPIIDLISETQQAEFKRTLQDFTLQGDEQGKRQEKIRANCADGSEVALKINLSHGRYEEEPCIELRIPSQDQDQDLALEMQKIKNRDPATELWNRQHLVDNINQLLASPAPQASVLLIEIDDFYEQVQNKVGLAASEDTLKQIAAVVQPCLDDTDILGRFADDAFMVLSQQTTVSAIEQTSQSILEKCANAIVEAGGRTAQFTVSIGIALINENSIDSDTIINQAAGALNDIRNSEENINQVKLYEPKQIGSGTSVDEIQEALSENRFRLLFQPVISLRGSSQEYYEVQLRMLDKSGDEVSPSNFLELAKSIGSGAKLDRWVILESMKALAKQRSRHPN
ncbi:MAG: diguanylate cyclase, partial [Cellvibrionaceae bacterium]|nr:diguanylate cyclase [Cellvibrionaceae bacterium]